MAAPGRVIRTRNLTPGELYQHHVRHKKAIALIAGLLLLPVSLLMIVAFDRGPLGQAASQALGFSFGASSPRSTQIAQGPVASPTTCARSLFNGLVYDADTNALLNGVQVTASFGDGAATSPDGEFNLPVCYDPQRHASFTLTFEKEGYVPTSRAVITSGYPNDYFRVADVGMRSVQSATPTLFQPLRQTPLPTTAASNAGSQATPAIAPTQAGAPAPTATAEPPKTLPVTGLAATAFPGQAVGFVLLAVSLMLIAAGAWPAHQDAR